MKRVLSLFVLLVLLAGLLAACGEESAPPADSGTGAQPTAGGTTAQETPAGTTDESTPTTETTDAETTPTTAAAAETTPTEPAPETIGAGGSKVVIWHGWTGAYANTFKQLLGEFASQNNLTLELLNPPSMNDRVNVAVPAGEGPDIIAWVNDQIGKNAEIGVIQPLNEHGFDQAFLQENYEETAVEAVVYNDQVYCVPESMEAIAFVYNKDLVSEEELPKDTNELLEKAGAFNEANPGKYYFVYQGGAPGGDPYHNAPWWYGHGAYYVQPDGTVGLDTPESIAAGQFLKELTTIMPKEIDADVSRALFTEGNAAIWLTGPWSTSDIEKAGINYGVAPIPTISETGQPGAPFVGVKCWMLAQGAKNVEGAVKVLQYVGSAEFQQALFEQANLAPAHKQAQSATESDEVVAGFLASAMNGVPLPSTPFMAVLWQPAGDAQRAIWSGTQEPEQALQDAAQLARENVDQLR